MNEKSLAKLVKIVVDSHFCEDSLSSFCGHQLQFPAFFSQIVLRCGGNGDNIAVARWPTVTRGTASNTRWRLLKTALMSTSCEWLPRFYQEPNRAFCDLYTWIAGVTIRLGVRFEMRIISTAAAVYLHKSDTLLEKEFLRGCFRPIHILPALECDYLRGKRSFRAHARATCPGFASAPFGGTHSRSGLRRRSIDRKTGCAGCASGGYRQFSGHDRNRSSARH